MIQQQTQVRATPNLKDLLNNERRDTLLGLNCHHVGTVQSFNPANQTAQITINYKKTYFRSNDLGTVEPILVDYPIIIDVPVIVLGGGNGAITFPIEPGDECLVLFNDRDIDNWFSSGSTSAGNATPRLHSFSDAIALVGVRSIPNVLPSYSTDAIEIRTKLGLAKVSITDDEIIMSIADQTVQLKLTSEGKFSVTNISGEFVTALLTALASATCAGFPLVIDLTTLTTFQDV